ncbi:MAG: NAD(P)-dependent oxidoreductase [Alphaproteobacteria bacterium]|jgi:nucleoside-diphosphate-sugar epimerase|nr:NAD(P)-dependent oxidoreductase [Alphaproteobacteria bacterium]
MAFTKPVLVTGAGGCIGSWVLARLVADDVEVVAFDLSDNKRRPALVMDEAALGRVRWLTGDIGDSDTVDRIVAENDIGAIIHLAALQVPFCREDPGAGARANVVGSVNIFQAARQHGVGQLSYASSVAVRGIGDNPWLATLYGAFKNCNEDCAAVYWQDWQVPSIGIRPGTVYGVARDQGMTSLPTVAMLHAAAGQPYTVPFTGSVAFVYAAEAADAFIQAALAARDGAPVFDLNGVGATVDEALDVVRRLLPEAEVDSEGDALPFPADLSDEPLREYVGGYDVYTLEQGIEETVGRFGDLLERGLVSVG